MTSPFSIRYRVYVPTQGFPQNVVFVGDYDAAMGEFQRLFERRKAAAIDVMLVHRVGENERVLFNAQAMSMITNTDEGD